MTNLHQVYKCNICGNIVEVLHEGFGELTCCNAPMQNMQENTKDASLEKHVPVIEKTDQGVLIHVGEAPHPMIETHYIEWIEVFTDGRIYKKFINPGDPPKAEFNISSEIIEVRAYCNLHGLWKTGS